MKQGIASRSILATLIAASITFTSDTATAGPDRVSLLLGSKHVGAERGAFNETNPGLFFTWEGEALDKTVGIYKNSYDGVSLSATVALPIVKWKDGEAALFAGAALYPDVGRTFKYHVGDVIPIGGLQIRHKYAFVQIIPMDGDHVDFLIDGGITFKMK
tara:strand:- start:18313 stop:18789 length:477 start_codon:yes stop_codon:yes gene_type:complete